MNSVALIGRLTRDPEIRYKEELAIARFTLAVARPAMKGKEATSDFPSCVAFGKTAELVERYLTKGVHIGVTGRIQTGSYTDKDGKKVYTTDVVIDHMEFLEKKQETEEVKEDVTAPLPGFEKLGADDIPF